VPGILGCSLVVLALGALGSPVFQLLAVFAARVFHVGDLAYGFLGASLGIGALIAAPVIAGPGTGMRRSRLVTVATPHEGSMHAWIAAGACLAQMRPGNAWLASLGAPRGDALPPIVSLWSWHDSMVAPQTSSRIGFGEDLQIAGVGHNRLLRSPVLFARLPDQTRDHKQAHQGI